jgi:hypothetical protein
LRVREIWRATGEIFDPDDWELVATDDTEALSVADSLEDYRTRTDSSIQQTASSILLSVESQYATKTDVEELSATVSSELAIRDEDITLSFHQQAQAIATNSTDLAIDKAQRDAWYRFDPENVEFGRENSPFRLLINNYRLAVMNGDTEAALFSAQLTKTQNIEVASSIAMGLPSVGQFQWTAKANGNLSLKWKGA